MNNFFGQNESILPGVVTNIISSYNKGYDSSLFGTTDSIVVIGTAFNGPVGVHIPVYGPEHAKYIFGPAYNSTAKKAATLVSGIKDAWDAGARTIYAVRISGKDVYKDYQLKGDTNFKLRMQGIFPSNSNKELALLYDDSSEFYMKLYKPAERATITEKNQGIVESRDSVIECLIDIYNNGLTKQSKLVELIDIVNKFQANNVLKLMIVDKDGNDVTQSSFEAKSLIIDDLFPGLYTIGRDKNSEKVKSVTDVKLNFTSEHNYDGIVNIIRKELVVNTDITKDFPIYAKTVEELSNKLGIPMLEKFDFLKVPNKIDLAFLKDKIDYEEVDLSDFELYKRLGSGYAITSCCVGTLVDDSETGEKVLVNPKVVETTDKQLSRVPILDGIYPTLESLKVKYRVVEGVYADATIKAQKPRIKDFEKSIAKTFNILGDSLKLSTNVKTDDLTESRPVFLSMRKITKEEIDLIEEATNVNENVYYEKSIKEVSSLDSLPSITKSGFKGYAKGSLFFVNNKLYSYDLGFTEVVGEKGLTIKTKEKLFTCNDKGLFEPTKATDLNSKKFAIIQNERNTFSMGHIVQDKDNLSIKILGTVNQILNQQDEFLITSISDTYDGLNVEIISSQFDYLTAEELTSNLNEDKDFSKIFCLEVRDKVKSQEYIENLLGLNEETTSKTEISNAKDKRIGYDTNLYIPYRTEDNFARQLTQHCTYTSIKTGPTHGFIGVKPLLDTSLTAISKKAQNLITLNLETGMIAKKENGSNMLDKDNIPYHIGRKISIIATQYVLTHEDNYQCIQNGAAGYAGLISTLPLDTSSTMHTISIPEPMYEFTNYQLEKLTAAGIVTIRKSYNKNWVVTDGVTMAKIGDPMKRLSASRISDAVEDMIRAACEPFIGKQNHLVNQNAIRTSIKAKLSSIKGILIEGFEFRLIIDENNTKLGIIDVDYEIVPIYEIKTIRNNIEIR